MAQQVGVPLRMAEELWHRLGFPHRADDDIAFTPRDVEALGLARDLVLLGILDSESQAALVRTWGRSFARLAEWQTNLLARLASEGDDPAARVTELTESVLPRLEALQTYIWRRHLASAASRLLAVDRPLVPSEDGGSEVRAPVASGAREMTVGFVDIVGYTSRTRSLSEGELVDWVEEFEDTSTSLVNDHGGRVIKTIGDEILFVVDDPAAAAEIALDLTELGADDAVDFPAVRAGLAHGPVVTRLGDVYGETVNIASRLTSVARPSTVVIDRTCYEVLSGLVSGDDPDSDDDTRGPGSGQEGEDEPSPYVFRRIRRTPVKGYSRLHPRRLMRRRESG